MKEYGVGVVRKEYYRLLVALCHAGGGVAHRFSIHLSTDNTHTQRGGKCYIVHKIV